MEQTMLITIVQCECCGLKEECTEYYINQVKSAFEGKWLCGLCAEAVRDEAVRQPKNVTRNGRSTEDAMQAHMSFCGKFKSNNPAIQVADGMKLILRRSSFPPTSSASRSSKKLSRSATISSHCYCT